ncbi:MAG: hypothetical protein NC925_00985 [Candidatus Omnitrophica bacterium]|nr:hypothetical protein [Candidatus Omnitrophota bacterium]MCM8831534.1 hypothetical protein [Candidatus Omnitrophota bacterium]
MKKLTRKEFLKIIFKTIFLFSIFPYFKFFSQNNKIIENFNNDFTIKIKKFYKQNLYIKHDWAG